MSSDDSLRSGSTGFVPRGIGMYPLFRCAVCQQGKGSAGRRLLKVRGLKQWVCAQCVPKAKPAPDSDRDGLLSPRRRS